MNLTMWQRVSVNGVAGYVTAIDRVMRIIRVAYDSGHTEWQLIEDVVPLGKGK